MLKRTILPVLALALSGAAGAVEYTLPGVGSWEQLQLAEAPWTTVCETLDPQPCDVAAGNYQLVIEPGQATEQRRQQLIVADEQSTTSGTSNPPPMTPGMTPEVIYESTSCVSRRRDRRAENVGICSATCSSGAVTGGACLAQFQGIPDTFFAPTSSTMGADGFSCLVLAGYGSAADLDVAITTTVACLQ